MFFIELIININYKENQMIKLNKYAREYIENKDTKLNYQNISKQMKEFSGAEYVIFNIFDEKEKDFTLVGIEGNKSNINKAMDELKRCSGTQFDQNIVEIFTSEVL